MNPKISIIIPVYNVEQYLRECLDSVINQTLKDIEIICVDDCSPDNCQNILNEYAKKDNRIKFVKHDKNQGLGPARNTGLEIANGEYVFFLDSDDYLELNILEKLYSKILVTYADMVSVSFENWHDELSESVVDTSKVIEVSLKSFTKVINNFHVMACGKLFSREFLQNKNLKFINSHDSHEDDGFSMKFLSAYPSYTYISDNGYFYRTNLNSITSQENKEKAILCKKHTLDDAIDYINKNCQDKKQLVKKVKTSYRYAKFYSHFSGLFRFIWEKYDKNIVICCIDIFKQKYTDERFVTKILGIKISEKHFAKQRGVKCKF